MKVPTLTVFSEYVQLTASSPVTVYSALQHMEHLVDMQPLALQLVVDFSAGVGGSVEAHIEHAGDGIYFLKKNTTSEIPMMSFGVIGAVNQLVVWGAEVFSAPPSHEYVRISVTLSTTTTSIANLKVYATGQRRVNRVRHVPAVGDEALTDHLRDRLPKGIAHQVEAFRRRAQMSPETLGELQRVWDAADASDDPLTRAARANVFLSNKARREVDRFHKAVRTLPPHVLPALKRGIARAAFDELARPEWRFDRK